MKIRILTGAILAVMGIGLSYAASLKVERIDPPHWWVGMKNTTLQLQVYGADIREAVPEINYPGVRTPICEICHHNGRRPAV